MIWRRARPAQHQHSPQYDAYMRSPAWFARRDAELKRAGNRCEHRTALFWRCECRQGLEAHHNTYDHLGHELPGEITILCKKHHKPADKKRWKEAHRGQQHRRQ
jgi:hypothetical protein